MATGSQGLSTSARRPCAWVMPVKALMAVSETPKRTPEAAPSMTPWCSTEPPMRGPMISRPPRPNKPASKEIMARTENWECAPCVAGRVTPSRIRPAAMSQSPSHCRGPTLKPNMRSAMTAMKTMPAARATCTTDMGASDRAATCSAQEPVATSIPSANHLEEYSCAGAGQRVA